ncbi:MAG: hypothetical protein AAFO07_20750 [Bacteroidota bacterium]
MAEKISTLEYTDKTMMALRREDVGNLETVLRDYYRSQIKSLERRQDRKLARVLLQDHLILPKSRQRTSKDAAYIKEVLGIDSNLLDKLEESRLIRRIHKVGINPIYEVSHDTLVEPILAERNNREVIIRFLKRIWIFVLLFLLLWFLFGMLFERSFELLPEPSRTPQSLDVLMDRQTLALEENSQGLVIPLPPVIVEKKLYPADSINIRLPITAVDIERIRKAGSTTGGDTISILFTNPIEVPINNGQVTEGYQAFSNVLVPIGFPNSANESTLYARVSGNLKMTDAANYTAERGVGGYNQLASAPINVELGDTLLRAVNYTRSIPVNFSMQLSDLFDNEVDKANVKNLIGDRMVNLNYTVQLGAVPPAPIPPKVELPSVQGVEVQYSDGPKVLLGAIQSQTLLLILLYKVVEKNYMWWQKRKPFIPSQSCITYVMHLVISLPQS